MNENPMEKQLELFDETGDKKQKPESGVAGEKAEVKKPRKIPPIFNDKDLKQILGEKDAELGESMDRPHGYPRRQPLTDAEKRLGWAGNYYGNKPDKNE